MSSVWRNSLVQRISVKVFKILFQCIRTGAAKRKYDTRPSDVEQFDFQRTEEFHI